MNVSFQSQAGIDIQLQRAVFHEPVTGQEPLTDLALLPAMRVDSTLFASIRAVGGIATATGTLRIESTGFGVLYAYGNGSLATLVFDLSRADVRRWLMAAKRRGAVPLLVQCEGEAKLVQVPFDADIEGLVDVGATCSSPSADDVVFALQFVLGQFESTETLSQAGLDMGPMKRASISLLVPSDPQETGTALH